MRNADTVLGVIRERHATRPFIANGRKGMRSGGRPLESCLRSKDSRAVRGGAVGKVPQGNSLAAYSTARPGPWEPWRVTARATQPEADWRGV